MNVADFWSKVQTVDNKYFWIKYRMLLIPNIHSKNVDWFWQMLGHNLNGDISFFQRKQNKMIQASREKYTERSGNMPFLFFTLSFYLDIQCSWMC